MAMYFIESENAIRDVPDTELPALRAKSPTFAIHALGANDAQHYYAGRYGRAHRFRTLRALTTYIRARLDDESRAIESRLREHGL